MIDSYLILPIQINGFIILPFIMIVSRYFYSLAFTLLAVLKTFCLVSSKLHTDNFVSKRKYQIFDQKHPCDKFFIIQCIYTSFSVSKIMAVFGVTKQLCRTLRPLAQASSIAPRSTTSPGTMTYVLQGFPTFSSVM